MPQTDTTKPAFTLHPAFHVTVQRPEAHLPEVLEAVQAVDPLTYGFYDQVSFATTPGVQRFRSCPGGRNPASETAMQVPCTELSFAVLDTDPAHLNQVLQAIFDSHPYEEPVIFVTQATYTRHVPGTGLDAPAKFWNRDTPDWVPATHRD
ncbi:hypothetical protein [Thalassovita taeanensis]|uniref:Uncharacterized protein n=1 Tax=Thalassovita taeanensis TaxID=657014 RepID=A0A1H8YV24_9RHOB|nr:hypothetical protein [Thalassovita taeanensis]SEP55957.1 hypothetical protein SAMN04488092_101138 [Thalassovita taeanensis]